MLMQIDTPYLITHLFKLGKTNSSFKTFFFSLHFVTQLKSQNNQTCFQTPYIIPRQIHKELNGALVKSNLAECEPCQNVQTSLLTSSVWHLKLLIQFSS